MSGRLHIVLSDTAAIMPQALRITVKPSAAEWDIRNIALYATEADARLGSFQGCLADDIRIHDLPQSSRSSIIGALNAYDHEQRQKTRELVMSVTA